MDIEQIAEKLKKGETHYFGQIIVYFEAKVFRTVYSMIRNRATAEDIVQDIFLTLYLNIHKYNGGSFNAWLYRIVVNHCYDYLRKNKLETSEIEEIIDESTPERILLLHERNKELEKIVELLDETERMILVLKYANELTYEEISEVLQIPLHDVRNKLHRTKKRLREQSTKKGGQLYEMRYLND